MLNFNKLNFKQRKKIHFLLIGVIIFLQILIALTWYNETYNEAKLDKINQTVISSDSLIAKSNLARNNFNEAQNQLLKYLNNREPVFLDNYYKSFKMMNNYIENINNNPDQEFKKILHSQLKIQSSADVIKSRIDSLLNNQTTHSNATMDLFEFKKFDYKDVLNSIDIESTTKVDSVKKKGLFGRIGGALSGKTDVQKEKNDILIKMKYGTNVSTGNIQDQIEKIFQNTNQYYKNEFFKFKTNFDNLKKKDVELIRTNDKLVVLSSELLREFDLSTKKYNTTNKEKYSTQSSVIKKVKTFTILLLLIVMIITTIILILFTKIAFNYEKSLMKAKYQIAQSLNFKSRIIGMISHEIRSPLSIISMLSRRVASRVEDKEIQDQFKSIDFTTNSLLQLSNQVLEYSKNEKVKPKLNNKSFELKNELNQIVTSLNTLVENKGNTLDFSSNQKEEIVVSSDLIKIHQLFYNIVGNANKFTEKGVIKINTTIDENVNNTLKFTVAISDTGSGISKEDLENVFESYYQGIISEKVNDIGAGLGLNLCKEIVELFEGNIKIESIINKGTTVTFSLILNKVS